MNPPLVVGARRSPLSRVQATWVGERLRERWPEVPIEYRFISTAGDRDPGTPLPEIGGKGLFTEDLERALREGDIDVAVHSLKDLPADLPDGLMLGAVPSREDPRDVLVIRDSVVSAPRDADGCRLLRRLPAGARVGTSSLRRAAQLLAARTDLDPRPIRGNVDTRLRKLEDGRFEALILAAAGLRRLGLWPRGAYVLDDGWLPAPGQGALGLQCRAGQDGMATRVRALDDPTARQEVTAERALLAALEGGCRVPIAARASLRGEDLLLRAAVYDVDGGPPVEAAETGSAAAAVALGRRLAEHMLEAGAARLVERARRLSP
ncbi:hydroxymethylbilane synthase [Candidatus Palauibacter soopunensis]|uniref:hydroxymethylbilane synthase n=1 Tax=Candidatus Palauibacter soopunensis TaxID=3056739 RepID=UPI00239C25B0|nr:hydroxymethylbilane synthase [Candidatus Palauibacter soopunensis]MDE2879188.1 hydroxymethylbilane synthase [Candidatus Palauibacter soopunensis]